MSEYPENFIKYLIMLSEQNRGAMAILRRSLAFEPGTWPQSYPYVERFVAPNLGAHDSRRLALYAVASLFASHPQRSDQSLASALGTLMRDRERAGIERRFISLLGADASNVVHYLRQIICLLAAGSVGLDYVSLLKDLQIWMNPHSNLDRLRQKWARDFYQALSSPIINQPE